MAVARSITRCGSWERTRSEIHLQYRFRPDRPADRAGRDSGGSRVRLDRAAGLDLLLREAIRRLPLYRRRQADVRRGVALGGPADPGGRDGRGPLEAAVLHERDEVGFA